MKKRIGKRSISVMSMMLAVVLAVGLTPGQMVFAADLTQEESSRSDVVEQEGTTSTESVQDESEQTTEGSIQNEPEVSADSNVEQTAEEDALSPGLLSAIQPLAEVSPMATDWTGTTLPADTTLTIMPNGTFSYLATEYNFASDGGSTLTADGNLTIVLNNTSPVKVKHIQVDTGYLTITGTGEMIVEDNAITYEGAVHLKDGTLTVKDATLKASGNTYGVYADSGYSFPGNIVVDNGVLEGIGEAEGVVANDDITVINGGVISGTGEDRGVRAWGSMTVNGGGSVSGIADYEVGILISMAITISSGSVTGSVKSDYSTGVYSGNITVENNGELIGTGGDTGVRGTIIEVSGQSILAGTATSEYSKGVVAGTSIVVDGEGSTLEGAGDYYGVYLMGMIPASVATQAIFVDAGSIVAQNGGVLTGKGGFYGIFNEYANAPEIIAKSDGEIIGTGDESGVVVWRGYSAGITAESGGTVTGTAPHLGVYGYESTIIADGSGSVVLGIATASDRVYMDEYESSAVMIDYEDPNVGYYIGATNEGVIWEDYPNIQLAFNDVTPVYPYDDGANVYSIANYDWMPDLEVDASVTGLLALRGYVDVQDIMGVRTGEATGEYVYLDSASTHMITFLGTLDGPMDPEPVDPPADPTDITTSSQTSSGGLAGTGDNTFTTCLGALFGFSLVALAGSCLLRRKKMQ